MYQSDAEILYPSRVTPKLRNIRGRQWQKLVQRVLSHPVGDDKSLAFGLMMIRLDGCLTCHADNYRAMRGCTACAYQTIERYKGSDSDLVAAFDEALEDVTLWRQTGKMPFSEQLPLKVQ